MPSILSAGRIDEEELPVRHYFWPDGKLRVMLPYEVSAADEDAHDTYSDVLPPLIDERKGATGCDDGGIRRRKLADGRVVVAGEQIKNG